MEQAIHEIVTSHLAAHGVAVEVVLPAGNNCLSRCHARIALPPGRSEVLPWRVLPDDRTPSELQIWLPFRPGGAGGKLDVAIASPGGVTRRIGETHGALRCWTSDAGVYARAFYVHRPAPTERGMFGLVLRPTARHRRGAALAPCGTWTITLTNVGSAPLDAVDAWVQRDDALYGYPRRGRQSHFDRKDYARFDHAGRPVEDDGVASCPVRRAGSINAMATGRKTMIGVTKVQTIAIGGYRRRDGAIAAYSAGGPTVAPAGSALPNRPGPDALAPSEDSIVHRGVLAAGSLSGSVAAMNGTSVAAPRVARWIADELAAGRRGDGDAVKSRAKDDEQRCARRAPRPPPARGGAGRMALDAIVAVRRCTT